MTDTSDSDADFDERATLPEALRLVYENVTTYSEGSSGDAQEEIRQLEALLEKSPDNKAIMEWLAFKLYSVALYPRAEELYRQLLDLQHRPGVQHFYLGNTYYRMGRYDDAVSEWEQTLALIPRDAKARKARARIDKVRREHQNG